MIINNVKLAMKVVKNGLSVSNRSSLSGQVNTMVLDITFDQFKSWKQGSLIQDVMPNLSADDREFLMTGITPVEWNEMFA